LLPAAVVAMGGQVASGKSTLARLVARQIGAPIVSSDRTREHLLQSALAGGAAPGSDADPIPDVHEAQWIQTYEPGFGDRIYDEVLRRAGEVLVSGRPVVIDGCFHSRSRREEARRLAERFGRPFLFVEVATTPEVQLERLRVRAVRDGVELDDWRQIAEGLRTDWEPVDELREREYLQLDGASPPERSAGAIEARLPTWPPEFRG
jgi:predicted kinase